MDPVAPHLPRIPRLQSLTPRQREQLDDYAEMLRSMNRKLNLVSRESDQEIASIHVPHAMAFAVKPFPADAVIVDWGTGGGLPAIPLAILNPDLHVHAVDAVEKKIFAVRAMARRLGLDNVETWAGDAAKWPGSATHSVSRATAPLDVLWRWHSRIAVESPAPEKAWRPGLLCLKGGDLGEELAAWRTASGDETRRLGIDALPLRDLYPNPYFETKYVVHAYEYSAG